MNIKHNEIDHGLGCVQLGDVLRTRHVLQRMRARASREEAEHEPAEVAIVEEQFLVEVREVLELQEAILDVYWKVDQLLANHLHVIVRFVRGHLEVVVDD